MPVLFSSSYKGNENLNNEKDVEKFLIEPLLRDLGYSDNDWVRQLVVKMGRGEWVFPDYALLSNKDKGFEQAKILFEAKFIIKNHKDFESAFRQVWSYGLRLSAILLIVADKNSLWLFERVNQGFDRHSFSQFYWKELQQSDKFLALNKIFKRHDK
ncbi:hypothetical protein LP109_10430 [Moraxella bovis]|uniref:hypothetical protein n=1 Tax=Moraxella bovis TaxID=476 RepID=UPI00099233AC|nr:hypothetical protein [Moraxella bovis]UZA16059.1 hypothetical protein LP109_10430 [Moraxella bovis]